MAIAGDDRRHIVQAVHKLMDIHPADPWGRDAPIGKIVLIGRNLEQREIEQILLPCLAGGGG